jgi:glucokinase
MKTNWTGVVGDVGGTHARFALVDDEGHARHPMTYRARDFGSLTEVLEKYLGGTTPRKRPPRAVMAVAGPVLDGEIEFTNLDWQVSEVELLAHFEFEAVSLINDFSAQALACPHLQPDDLRILGPAIRPVRDCPVVVMGAGTGFGVAGLARSARGDVPISTEGGHASFAPGDELEVELWRRARARHGRTSIERLLCGAGLYDIYCDLAEMAGAPADLADEAAVMTAGLAGAPAATAALDRFAAILGSVAGDLALSFGARGGVFISGGIAPRMADRLAASPFRTRFEAKGRMSDYVRAIPTSLIIHPYPAIVGAARALGQLERM